jgi:sulfide:quinone oxidoreductase
MDSSARQTKVLIVGGGVAALEAALALRHYAGDRVQTKMLAPEDQFVYRPMSVGEPFGHAIAHSYPLDRIIADLEIERCADTLQWVDTTARVVHTERDQRLKYDALLLAIGARPYAPPRHALTIDPTRLDEQLHDMLHDLEGGRVHNIAFVIPEVCSWPLPIYELALMTAARAREMNVDTQITLVTPEQAPLEIFGTSASAAVSRRLGAYGIATITSAHCAMQGPRSLTVSTTEEPLTVDHVVTLPALHGPAVPGIPRTAAQGFISVDCHSRVTGLDTVFAAGDMTDFPIKLGGVAADQADAAAESIAALAGAEIQPRPLVARIHGVLLGGGEPLYMQAQVTGSRGTHSRVSADPLWTPATRIYARYLAPYLQSLDAVAHHADRVGSSSGLDQRGVPSPL